MRKSFSGVWATFEYLDDICAAIQELRNKGYAKLTTHTPCPRHEIDDALGNPQSSIPYFTLAGGIVGFGLAVLVIIKMTLNWILPVSGKPVVSIPIMGPIAFELSVLIAIFFTIGGLFYLILRDTWRHTRPGSKKYKSYNRFMRDRFGLVVPCDLDQIEEVESIFKKYLAEEVIVEN